MKLLKVWLLKIDGIFTNLNRFISRAEFGREYIPVPVWPNSLYHVFGDTWDQFFERVGHTEEDLSKDIPFVSGYFPNITPHKDVGSDDQNYDISILLPPKDRYHSAPIINKWIKPKAEILDKVKGFHEKYLAGKHVVGLHIRGAGRIISGGVALFIQHMKLENPPYQRYFERIEKHLTDSSVIFLGTDSLDVQGVIKKRYGDKVICSTDYMLPGGETHENSEGYCKLRLGREALIDGWLLSMSDVFIHGSSNMSNFILCKSPDMPNEDVYEDCYHLNYEVHRSRVVVDKGIYL
jgi:hypothetical protein